MKKLIRTVSVILTSIMFMSSFLLFSGCSTTKKVIRPEYISEDQPWFESTKIEINIPYDKSDFEYIDISEPAYLDDYIYAVFQGYKIYDVKDESNPDFDYNSTIIRSILKFDLDGNYVEELKLGGDQYKVGYVTGLKAYGDKLKITGDVYDNTERCYLTTNLLMDPKTNTFEKEALDIDIEGVEDINAEYQVGDKKVYVVADYISMNFRFVISGQETKSVSINNAVEGLQNIDSCIVIDDNTLLGFCYGKEYQVIELNVNSGEIKNSDINIDLGKYTFYPVQNGKAYASNKEGVYTINEKFEIECVLDYNNTLTNLYDLNFSTPLYVDDDKIVVYTDSLFGNSFNYSVYVFKRASNNPNVGKRIIDVFSMIPYVTYTEAEAIYRFNQANEEYFATLRFSDYDATSSDEIENNKAIATASNQLMVDIMAGDGPDIVLNGFDCSEFNNPNYFIDINQLIAKDTSFDKTLYFDNIIEASQNEDGALYQIPASYLIDCIVSRVSDVGEGHIGFTYADYDKFLHGACNGISPINESKTNYLDLCIASGYFDYLRDGKVDFNNEDFIKACDFANSYFPEDIEDEIQMVVINASSGCLNEPQRLNLIMPFVLMWEVGGTPEPVGFYGFPSLEEHGPIANIASSAAISVGVDDAIQNACWEFIKIMLSEDVQSTIVDSFPMNKASLSDMLVSMADEADEVYNKYIKMGFSEAEIVGFGAQKVNRAILDSFYNAILSVTNVSRSDSSIEIIIAEEIPAYFTGQKDIDSVINIINDRAQTIYDERK